MNTYASLFLKMGDIVKKKRSRAGINGYINKLIKTDIKEIYDDYKDGDIFTLISLKAVIEEKLSNIIKLSEEIQELIEDEAGFKDDFEKYSNIEVSIRRDLTVLSDFITSKQEKSSSKDGIGRKVDVSSSETKSRWKLPRFDIKKFTGDPTEWKTFIESFNVTVHKNNELSNIEKMNFLINRLEGEAGKVVNGLKLCSDNYPIAKQMLEERFGDPQVLISSHMSKLLSLEVVFGYGRCKNVTAFIR